MLCDLLKVNVKRQVDGCFILRGTSEHAVKFYMARTFLLAFKEAVVEGVGALYLLVVHSFGSRSPTICLDLFLG